MITMPLWVIGAGKTVKGVFKAVPLRVWLIGMAVIAILITGYLMVSGYGDRKLAEGVAQERAAWVKAQKDANDKQEKETKKRDKAADGIATDTKKDAAKVVAETKKETAKSVERVKNEMSKNPMACANPDLPASVSNAGREAVKRAAAAASEM